MEENEYDTNRRVDKTYFSPSLPAFGQLGRSVRIATKAFQSSDDYAFGTIKGEVVIRSREGAKKYVKATFFEDDRSLRVLNIQGFSAATDKPHDASFAFIGKEIETLVEFLNNIQSLQLDDPGGVNAFDTQLRKAILSKDQAAILLEQNEEVLAEALRTRVTKEDIVAVGYRKRQLERFARLLDDRTYFNSLLEKHQLNPEALWQRFFEKNTWMFGYGLGYLFLSTLDGKKLEQVVQGYDLKKYGKRADGVMKTRGAISNLCFVEIKTHETPLLASKPYRVGCWAPSMDLTGAVAQVQGTVHASIESLGAKLSLHDEKGFPTGEEAFNYQPNSFLVAGNLQQFVGKHGANSEQVKSFELYRKGTASPNIITFDELYERARYIVNHNE